jgi:hypothetical protein
VDTGIGFAISHNQGDTFERIGDGPIMSSTINEPVLVGDPFVQCYNGIFHMWYLFGLGWKKYADAPPDRIYKIAHATSLDGINWNKEEGVRIIADKLNEDECQEKCSRNSRVKFLFLNLSIVLKTKKHYQLVP